MSDDGSVFREQLNALAMVPEIDPDVVLIKECRNGIVYGNPAARRWLTERGLESLDGLFDLLPPQFQERFCATCDHRSPRRESYERDGRLYDLQITPIVATDRCVMHVHDVTELVRIQRERAAFFQAIESVGNAVAITDGDGAIEYINPAFAELYGVTAEEARGRNPRVINPGPDAYWNAGFSDEQYRELFAGMWASLNATGQWRGEVLNRVASGELRWINLIITRIAEAKADAVKYVAVATDIDSMRRKQLTAYLEILETITRLAELRDNETGRHMKRVGLFARILAERVGQPLRFCNDIELFAPLHDVGKVGIPDSILLAPRKLTSDEFETIKRHTTLGFSILSGRPTLEMAAEIVHGHHEWWDGSGYPEGLRGDEIPRSARIAAVSDVYDALRSDRPYKQAWTHEQTCSEILTQRGSHFDPEIVDAFEDLQLEFAQIATEYSDD